MTVTIQINHRGSEGTKEERPMGPRFILSNLKRTEDASFPRSFLAFVRFVVS